MAISNPTLGKLARKRIIKLFSVSTINRSEKFKEIINNLQKN